MVDVRRIAQNTVQNLDVFREAARARNLRVLMNMVGPAMRGFVLQRGKNEPATDMRASHDAHFDWTYERTAPELARLYEVAKTSQWNAATDIDWTIAVDPENPERELFPEELLPLESMPGYRSLPDRERRLQRFGIVAWMLSQFLHGEQGALFAACQVTEAVHGLDGKLYGATQVVDEARHVEVFHRYLGEKLEKTFQVNDNLFVIIDALMGESRWDFKFLGMQILIEGLALGAFGTMRTATREPLLKKILTNVITDEGRHVHYGVVALRDYYAQIPEKERREREDWAFEVSVLMRNRFLAHEFYEEYYAHALSRAEWDRLVLGSPYMERFRRMMFKRLIPNLKKINLLSDRVRPHYESLGLLQFENEKSAPELTTKDLLQDAAA
jgi:hypothetical protein